VSPPCPLRAARHSLTLALIALSLLAAMLLLTSAPAGARSASRSSHKGRTYDAKRRGAGNAHPGKHPKHNKHAHKKHKKHHKAEKKSSKPGSGESSGSGSGEGSESGGGSSGNSGGSSGADPFAGRTLYLEPYAAALATEQQWRGEGRTAEANEIAKLAGQPAAVWLTGGAEGHGSPQGAVEWTVSKASAAGQYPVLVAYDIPWRDCGQYSAGGASSPEAYEQWINELVAGIDGRAAAVILEPDALSEIECLSSSRQSSYYALLRYAVSHLAANANVAVYIDAGEGTWQPAATIAARLREAGVAGARGFALNVSNFDSTAESISYGAAIDAALGSEAHFVIDTSRNGRGAAPGDAWCNPSGRGLGTPPTAQTASPLADAYLWIKTPGESDGSCNGGPSAGAWWASYALELAENASF
jgi:endoglucanase